MQVWIISGKLPAQKIGNSNFVQEKELEFVKERTQGQTSESIELCIKIKQSK